LAKPRVHYSRELADRICDHLSQGKSLRSICQGDAMPDTAAVRQWAKRDVDGFQERYADALDTGHDAIADELRHLTDGAKPEDAPLLHVKARVLIHLLSKWNPGKYGERVQPQAPPMLGPIIIHSIAPTRREMPLIEAKGKEVDRGEPDTE
jgi:hypothetical protein